MATSSDVNEVLDLEQSNIRNQFSISDRLSETSRSMRVLERLASTLGVPFESFFAETGRSPSSNDAMSDEIADLTMAFAAIADPVMRRYCLDVVRAAGAEESGDGRAAVPV